LMENTCRIQIAAKMVNTRKLSRKKITPYKITRLLRRIVNFQKNAPKTRDEYANLTRFTCPRLCVENTFNGRTKKKMHELSLHDRGIKGGWTSLSNSQNTTKEESILYSMQQGKWRRAQSKNATLTGKKRLLQSA
jgi:hypothetical protein